MGWKNNPATVAAAAAPATTFTPAQPTAAPAPPTQPAAPAPATAAFSFSPTPPTAPVAPPPQAAAPAPLPPVQPPAPMTPAPAPVAATAPPDASQAQAAPAAAAPRRGRRPAAAAAASTAPAAQAATPAAPASNLPAVAAPTSTVGLIVSGGQLPGFLSLFAPPASGQGLAASLIQSAQSQGEPNLFPTNFLVGGDQGGMLKIDAMNEEGSDVNLHDGSKPQYCVVLGYRSLINAWPKAYDKNDQNRAAPRWKGQIGQHDAAVGDLVASALKNYTFRDRELSSLFDAYGHPQLATEFLCYDDKVGFYCTRTTWDFDSCVESLASFIAGLPPSNPNDPLSPKVYTPYPCRIDVVYKDKSSKKNNQHWKSWFFNFARLAGPEVQAASASFQQMITQSSGDPELNNLIAEWNATTLKPEHLQHLQAIADLAAR